MNSHHPMHDEETAATLSGASKANALRALRVLSEAAGAEASVETETPPLPAQLRDQWQEAYGETPASPSAPEPVATRERWVTRVARLFATPRAAWAGGLVAAAAVVILLAIPHEPAVESPGGTVVTRGTPHVVPETGGAARLIVVAAADKAGPLMAELGRAFPSRRIERANISPAGKDNAIIVETAKLEIRRAGEATATPLSGDPLTNPESVITAIEQLDDPEPR